jgi:SAM-dependent methyltransferase
VPTETDEAFPGWDWLDPEAAGERLEEFSADIAQCAKLETVAPAVPRERAQLAELGITGIEFAAFRTIHPTGLASDLAPLTSPEEAAEPGPLYRVDGESLFTRLDIGAPLPFADASVDWVYAEHLLEHVTPRVAVGWLTEVRRILAPGGLLRLSTPDLAKYVEGYQDGQAFYAKHRRRLSLMRVGPKMPERKAFMFNQIFYLYGHRWIYDLAEVGFVLEKGGFDAGNVRACAYQEGARPDVAALDTAFRRDESLYVEVTA